MDRRFFSSLGIAAAAGGLMVAEPSPAQESPAELKRALPSPLAGPSAGSPLPELPAPRDPAMSDKLLPGFKHQDIKTAGAVIHTLVKGNGPPLLLLHGHPETHVTWHKIAPALAEKYTVVLTDLRGYGDSSKPEAGPDSSNYSFRPMGDDQIEVMAHLGFKRFLLAGHDRGGRVAHRMCLDHPEAIEKVAVLDIAPTLTMYDSTNKEFAEKYVWWFLQIQPTPMPEHLIGLDPVYYIREHLDVQGKTPGAVTPEAMAEYIRCYCCKGTIHGVCSDYRAAAGIDLDYDRADDKAGHKIQAPMLALWGGKGVVGKLFDVLATWRPKSASSVTGKALDCGHLLPEEQPEAVQAEFEKFFS